MLCTVLNFYISLLLMGTTDSGICRCRPEETIDEALQNSSAVFSGKVIAIDHHEGFSEAIFEVDRIWMGPIYYHISVISYNDVCKKNFANNFAYKVYANENQDGILITNRCTRTDLIYELKKIRKNW